MGSPANVFDFLLSLVVCVEVRRRFVLLVALLHVNFPATVSAVRPTTAVKSKLNPHRCHPLKTQLEIKYDNFSNFVRFVHTHFTF